MNERIEELIIAYLHRGATPEQEKELFQACSSDPEIAANLRRHLTLSLTLRQLRDATEVPVDLRNSLLGKINTLKPSPEVAKPALSFGIKAGVFNWRHVFGTAFAGAALAAIGFLAFQPSTIVTVATTTPPTTIQVRTDTVTRYRDVPQIVYVARPAIQQSGSSTTPVESPENITSIPTPGPLTEKPGEALTSTPTIAQNQSEPPIEVSAKPESFTTQYAAMLASLPKVRLSETDRVRD